MVRKGREAPRPHRYDGLLVAHGDIAPGQDEEELPVVPEVAPVVLIGLPDRAPRIRMRSSTAASLMTDS